MKMHLLFSAVVVVLGVTAALDARAASVGIAADGMLEVNGERLFVVGLYENPKEDEILKQAAEAGINLVYAANDPEALDRLHHHGLYAWVNTGAAIDLSADRETRETALRELAGQTNPHPALLVWEVPDEALWNCWYEAVTWRRHQEPGALRELVDALEDQALQQKLREQLDQASALYGVGKYAEAEALSDDVWTQLGKTSPRPGLGIGNAEERAQRMCAGMMDGYQFLKQIAPDRPIWMNHAPRNQISQLAAFNAAADIVGCDIYPVPFHPKVGHSDLKNRALSSVGDYTERMQEAAPGKPVWMVLQAFGWGDIQPQQPEETRKELRRPTLKETRFMAYDAMARGARGILYWGSMAVEKDSDFWREFLTFVAELKELQPILAAPDAAMNIQAQLRPTFGSIDRGVRILAKETGAAPWLLVVNEWTDPVAYVLTGLDACNGAVYRERLSGETARVEDGALALHLAGEAVHILEPVSAQP